MTDAQIVMLIMGIFYAAGFVGLIVLEVHLIRILISLRPENCEKCTGFFKEKSVNRGWRNGDEYDFFDYKYTYKVDGAEYEFHGGCRFEVKEEKQEEYKDDDYTLALNRKKAEEPDKYALPETIEVLYSVKCPKRAFSHDVDNYDNPWYDKIFIGIVAFFIVVCIWAVIFCFTSIL
jgi:hypothetical protein